jgi:NADPH2:quinone reductase
MRATTIVDGRIELTERPDPVPGPGQILVRVRAAGINGADLLQRAGNYPPPAGYPEDLPGLEFAGEVLDTGSGSARFRAGDLVMAVTGGAAQCELVVVHEREALPVPPGIPAPEAGGFPEVFTTAHDALFTQAQLTVGERLLVHGAAGGVGSAAVQLGVAAGATVVATVRSADNRPRVAELGATAVAPGEEGEHGPFDVILELVGASNLPANLDHLAIGGRICIIGVGGGGAEGPINLHRLMVKRGRMLGSTLRARPLEAKADAARRVERSVLPLLADGRVRVPVAATFPAEQGAEAYERFARGAKFGKVVITF